MSPPRICNTLWRAPESRPRAPSACPQLNWTCCLHHRVNMPRAREPSDPSRGYATRPAPPYQSTRPLPPQNRLSTAAPRWPSCASSGGRGRQRGRPHECRTNVRAEMRSQLLRATVGAGACRPLVLSAMLTYTMRLAASTRCIVALPGCLMRSGEARRPSPRVHYYMQDRAKNDCCVAVATRQGHARRQQPDLRLSDLICGSQI